MSDKLTEKDGITNFQDRWYRNRYLKDGELCTQISNFDKLFYWQILNMSMNIYGCANIFLKASCFYIYYKLIKQFLKYSKNIKAYIICYTIFRKI